MCVFVSEVRGQYKGLVHISQLRSEEWVRDINDVVRRGQKVKVKVLSITGKKMSLNEGEAEVVKSGNVLCPLSPHLILVTLSVYYMISEIMIFT